MAVKSIIDIDVNSEAFTRFKDTFDKYQAALGKLPGAWGKIDKGVTSTAESFADMTAALLAQQELLHKQRHELTEVEKIEKRRASLDRQRRVDNEKILKTTKDTAKSVAAMTLDLFKWVGIGGVLGGLVGAGGLMGLDSLANAVGGSRRAAQGLGINTGQLQSMNVNLSRYFDPQSAMTNIANMRNDPSQFWGFSAMGLNPNQDPATLAMQAAVKAKQIFDPIANSPAAASIAQARGLTNIFSMEDLRRFHSLSMTELQQSIRRTQIDAKTLAMSDDVNRRWQDFGVSLTHSKVLIENALVRGLEPLVPQLTKLSAAFADTITSFLANPELKKWLDEFASGIEQFAHYLGTPQFAADAKAVADGIGSIAKAIKWATGPASGSPKGPGLLDPVADAMHAEAHIMVDPFVGAAQSVRNWAINANNPGNLRNPNGKGFAHFATKEAGVLAMATQLERYEYSKKFGHADTLNKIISIYAPAGDHNDVGAYVRDVSRQTGFAPNQHLELSDKTVLSKLVAAMTRHEDPRKAVGQNVVITILNDTGNQSAIQASALPR